jgi:hypothetical protein
MVCARADDIVQNEARVLHRQHAASLFIDTALDPTRDTRCLAAVSSHFLLEPHAPIQTLVIESPHDVLFRLYSNELAGPQGEL